MKREMKREMKKRLQKFLSFSLAVVLVATSSNGVMAATGNYTDTGYRMPSYMYEQGFSNGVMLQHYDVSNLLGAGDQGFSYENEAIKADWKANALATNLGEATKITYTNDNSFIASGSSTEFTKPFIKYFNGTSKKARTISGYLKLEKGNNKFTINSDDGFKLTLDTNFDNQVDTDVFGTGWFTQSPAWFDQVYKVEEAGYYRFTLDYFDWGGEGVISIFIDNSTQNNDPSAYSLMYVYEEPSNVPQGQDDKYSVTYGQTLTVSTGDGVMNNDTNTVSVELGTTTTKGTLTLGVDGSIIYTPSNDPTVIQDSFTYRPVNANGIKGSLVNVTIDIQLPTYSENDFYYITDDDGRIASLHPGTNPFVIGVVNTDDNVREIAYTGLSNGGKPEFVAIKSTGNNDTNAIVGKVDGNGHFTTLITDNGSFYVKPTALAVDNQGYMYLAIDYSGNDGSDIYRVSVNDLNDYEKIADVNIETYADIVIYKGALYALGFKNSQVGENVLLTKITVENDAYVVTDVTEQSGVEAGKSYVGLSIFDGQIYINGYAGNQPTDFYQVFGSSTTSYYQAPNNDTILGAAPVKLHNFVTINHAPVAKDDQASVNEDTAKDINVLSNDTDKDGDALTVSIESEPTKGSVAVKNNGEITYTPDENALGTDSFTYKVSDGRGGYDTATVNITINEVNDAPVAKDDQATVDEDEYVNIPVLDNDDDEETADANLKVTSVTNPAHGTVSIDNQRTVIYMPNSNYYGDDSFTYTMTDGVNFATATVNVKVEPINDPPVGMDDTATTLEDTAKNIPVVANDTDPDNEIPVVDSVSQPEHGHTSIASDGTVLYTPDPDFHGVDSFEYYLKNGQDKVGPYTVTVSVTSVNDGPIAVNDSAEVEEEGSVDVDVLLNDSDPEGDVISLVSVGNAQHGTTSIDSLTNKVVYKPTKDYVGTDSFQYTIKDANNETSVATVTITVTNVNDAPVGLADTATTDEDTPVTIDVLKNDTDIDGDTLSIESVEQPSVGGSVAIVDGKLVFTPEADHHGTVTFTYVAEDPSGLETQAITVTVTVIPVNDAPVAVDDSANVDEDSSLTVDVLENDSDVEADASSTDNEKLTITNVSDPAHGTTEIVLVNGVQQIKYTPVANYNGPDSFVYTISDGNDVDSKTDTATVSITVAPVNDAPVGVVDTATTDEDTSVTIDVLKNDTDVDGDTLSIDSVEQPSVGGGVAIVDGKLVFTPAADYHGSVTFTYIAKDPSGLKTQAITVAVTVTPINDAPVAVDDSANVDEDSSVTVDVLENDSDVEADVSSTDNEKITITNVTDPAHGSAEIVAVNGVQQIKYTPDANYNGPDSFVYTISDGNGIDSKTDTATVSITIAPVNDAPVGVADTATTDEDIPVTINVLKNDTDVDGDTLSIESVEQPIEGGSVAIVDGKLVFTPAADYNGTVTFTYIAEDPSGAKSEPITVIITVNETFLDLGAVNDPGEEEEDITVEEDGALAIDVRANDLDEGTPAGLRIVTQPENGTVVIGEDGKPVYTPEENFNGTDSFIYELFETVEGVEKTSAATVTVVVAPENDQPLAVNDTATVVQGQSITIKALDNDSDIDGDSLTIVGPLTAANGSVTIDIDGNVVYTAGSSFTGEEVITYTVTDGSVASESATITITVTAAPVVTPPTGGGGGGTTTPSTPTGGGTDEEDIPEEDTPAGTPGGNTYADISDEELALALVEFYEPYIKGYPDVTFRPKRAVSRIEMATIFARILKLDVDAAPDAGFSDVPTTHWGYKNLNAVAEIGLINGYDDKTFKPDQAMTRAEIATIISRYWDYTGFDADDSNTVLTDVSSHWARTYINELYNFGLISGFEDGSFKPNDTLIREQVVVVINNLINRPEFAPEVASFPDAPSTHWAYGDVEAATRYFEKESGSFGTNPFAE